MFVHLFHSPSFWPSFKSGSARTVSEFLGGILNFELLNFELLSTESFTDHVVQPCKPFVGLSTFVSETASCVETCFFALLGPMALPGRQQRCAVAFSRARGAHDASFACPEAFQFRLFSFLVALDVAGVLVITVAVCGWCTRLRVCA